jgi:peptidoglycan/xylan/chitin deacetylase (PgdA/CDA1 family)
LQGSLGEDGMGLRNKVIGLGFAVFRTTRLHRLARSIAGGQGVALMFHHVRPWRPSTPGFHPNRLLEITPDFFEATLATVRRFGFEFVSMDEALRRLADGGPPFAAVTFDDGYRDLAEFALPTLERYGAPFTAYVATGFASRTAEPWWIALEEAIRKLDRIDLAGRGPAMSALARTSEEKAAAFNQIYWMLRAGPEDRLHDVVRDLSRQAGVDGIALVDRLCMNWREIATLAGHPLATIGAHTVRHLMLSKWSDDIVRAEMATSKIEIERHTGRGVRHFAYPVGDRTSAGPREFALARELGFASAVTTRPGMLFRDHAAHPTALPRLSVNGEWQNVGDLEVLLSGAPFLLWNQGRRLNVA